MHETGHVAAAAARGTSTVGSSQLVIDDDHNVVVGREGDLITGTCIHGEGGPIHVSAGELQPAP